jgi:hypothetical protein
MFINERRTDLWCYCFVTVNSQLAVTSSAAQRTIVKMLAVRFNAAQTGRACVAFAFPAPCVVRPGTTQHTHTHTRSGDVVNSSLREYSNATRRHFVELSLRRVRFVTI